MAATVKDFITLLRSDMPLDKAARDHAALVLEGMEAAVVQVTREHQELFTKHQNRTVAIVSAACCDRPMPSVFPQTKENLSMWGAAYGFGVLDAVTVMKGGTLIRTDAQPDSPEVQPAGPQLSIVKPSGEGGGA